MKKIIITTLLIFLMLVFTTTVFSTWCYQEYTNQSNGCGDIGNGYYIGFDNGDFDSNMIDGDWDTLTLAIGDGYDLYSVYNVNSSVVGGIWQTKDDEFGITNYTLEDNCLFNNNGTMKIRITYSTYEGEEIQTSFQEIYCLDQNDVVRQIIDIRTYSGDEAYYEDAINWNIVENPTYCYQESANVSTTCGGKNTGYYNITGMDDPQLAMDGNWTTLGLNGIYRVIYDKPENVTTAKVQFKCDGSQGIKTWNYSLNENCISNTNSLIQIVIPYDVGSLTCKNSTGHTQQYIKNYYSSLESEPSPIDACDSGIVEEAIYWILPTSEEVIDLTPPEAISGLTILSTTNESINWDWSNPSDLDFNHTELYLDDVFLINTSDNFVSVTGLQPDTEYTLKVYSVDNTGNRNESFVSNTTRTEANVIIVPVEQESRYAFILGIPELGSVISGFATNIVVGITPAFIIVSFVFAVVLLIGVSVLTITHFLKRK